MRKTNALHLISILLFVALTGCYSSRTGSVIPEFESEKLTGRKILFCMSGMDRDSLQMAIREAHSANAGVFLAIDANDPVLSPGIALHDQKAILKQKLKSIAESGDIDGVALKVSGLSAEIIEHALAEALMVKPYLLCAVVCSTDNDRHIAAGLFDRGIADLVIQDQYISFNKVAEIAVPVDMKRIRPDMIFGLDLSELFSNAPAGQEIFINGRDSNITTDSEGVVNFIAQKKDTLVISTGADKYSVITRGWIPPFRYSVNSGGSAVRKNPWVEFRRLPDAPVNSPEIEVLCKSYYPSEVSINDLPVKQYRTGIFFTKVALKEGINRIEASVVSADSLKTTYTREVIYEKHDRTRSPVPLWIDEKSIQPAGNTELLPEDMLRVTFIGSKGQEGSVSLLPGKKTVKCARKDYDDHSVYSADVYLKGLRTGKPYKIVQGLRSEQTDEKIQAGLQVSFTVRDMEDFPLVQVKNHDSRLTYNLGAPRLGGPIRAELEPGVILKTSGISGDYYRIRLSRTEEGYLHKDDCTPLPAGAVRPAFSLTSLSCGPSEKGDVLSIPYPEPVPYEVYPEPDLKRIVITLFGVQAASTWITHLNGRKIIRRITWTQTDPETYRICVNLLTDDIWGYDIKKDGGRLLLTVKYPPSFNIMADKPLEGLKIALEAGHGGSGTGAVGLSGIEEKTINLDLSYRIGDICRKLGADVVQVRDSDVDMLLTEKRKIALDSGADILVSIHANAGGRGYLSVSGTSTYWHNPFWAPLAQNIYERLLELDLKEFGVVGSFNYTVTRTSAIPSVLVEQAFMSHAEDEEKLADPVFRQAMAEKIVAGLMDYLRSR